MGVRDVGEVPGGAWRAGHAAGDDDGRREGRKRDAGMVGGRGDGERGGTGEPGGDRIGIDDGAGGEFGRSDIYWPGAEGHNGL